MSFVPSPEAFAPAPEMASRVSASMDYSGALEEHEQARQIALTSLQQEHGDLEALRERLVAEQADPLVVAELDALLHPSAPDMQTELRKWYGENPAQAEAISAAAAEYKTAWHEIFETVKNWGARAVEIIESLATGAIQVLKMIPKTTLTIALALIVIGGGLYGGLELLQLAEWGGFELIKDQLVALVGEGVLPEDFTSILPELHDAFDGLGDVPGEHLGKPLG